MTNNNNAIEIKNLSVNLDRFGLKNIDLIVPKGMVMGLIGKNGAGKSTLIKSVNDCFKLESGKILVDGTDCKNNRVEYFTKLQTVFDEPLFNTELKVDKIIELSAKAYRNFNLELFTKN